MSHRKKKTRETWPLSRRVEVQWEDAGSSAGWRSRDETAKMDPLMCRSLGYVVTRTKKKIVLAASQSASNGDCGDRMVIPAQWIRNVRRV